MLRWLTRLSSRPSFSETVGEAKAYITSELEKMGWKLSHEREMALNLKVQRKFGLTEERVAYITHDVMHQNH